MTSPTSHPLSLAGLAIHVSDLERQKDYYQKLPGARLEHHQPGFLAVLKIGDNRLNLVRLNVQPPFHLELDTADVDALHGQFLERGLSTDGPPEDKPWGERSFYTRDPEGNRLEFSRERDGDGSSAPERAGAGVRLTGFALHARDVAAMRAYYLSLPGVTLEHAQGDHLAVVRIGQNTLNLVHLDLEPRFHLELEVEDIDAFYADMDRLGLSADGPPDTKRWGERVVYGRDPEGNHLEFSTWVRPPERSSVG